MKKYAAVLIVLAGLVTYLAGAFGIRAACPNIVIPSLQLRRIAPVNVECHFNVRLAGTTNQALAANSRDSERWPPARWHENYRNIADNVALVIPRSFG